MSIGEALKKKPAPKVSIDLDKILDGLNPEQEEVALHDKGPLLVAAVAGAGKTESLIRRIGYLVAGRDVDPARILAVTFSRKGAAEMMERLDALIPDHGARIGTFHSLALQILKAEIEEYSEWSIDDRNKYRFCIKDAVGYREMNWKEADVTLLESFIGFCKANMARPDSDVALEIAQQYAKQAKKYVSPSRMVHAYQVAEELRRSKYILTFDDMLLEAVELLMENEGVRKRWAGNWDYVMQDEAQDQNLCQLMMGELLAKDHRNYMLIGDPSQCHPPGTMIDVDGKSVAIEDLDNGFSIRSWNRQSQKMVGGRKIEVGSRQYDGHLFNMVVGDRSVEMTDNHKVLCRWTDRSDRETCVTYIMYREGLGYRVGHCQLFANRDESFNFHLATRAKLEGADKTWILNVHPDRRAASIYESIIAARYGLPTATFNPVHNNKNLDSDAITTIFDSVRDNNTFRGISCLNDHGREVAFPLLPLPPQEVDGKNDDDVQYRRSTYFPVYACNLIPNMMSVPLPDGRNNWATIDSVSTREYSGQVYSLDVEKDHSYSANGIVVLNCIYSWRGARPEKLLDFEQAWESKVIHMHRNYRCGNTVVAAANASLGSMDPRTKLDMTMTGERGNEGVLSSIQYADLDAEAEALATLIAEKIQDGAEPRQFAVLYRTNAQSRAPEEALIAARVPYRVIGGACFYERREVKNLLAYLRLAAGTGDLDDIGRCINTPFRFLGKAFVERVKKAAKPLMGEAGCDWSNLIRDIAEQGGVQRRQRDSANQWADIVDEMAGRIVAARSATERGAERGESDFDPMTQGLPARILEDIVRQTRYTEWLTKDEGEESTENSRVSNIREMIRAATRFTSVDELLEYVDKTIAASKDQSKDKDDPNKVTLCSLHRSKGLEWPVVFLTGCAQGILPHGRAEDPEEERRLFYVGVTRARDELHLSCARRIALSNRVLDAEPSEYLQEIGMAPTFCS